MGDGLIVTVVGYDESAMITEVTSTIKKLGGNITSIKTSMISDFLIMNLAVDVSKITCNRNEFIERVKESALRVGVGVSIEDEGSFSRKKRLVAFDMDGTILDVEAIDEIAKYAGVQDKVSELTRKAMNGEINFEEALRERVRLLRGLPVKVIEEVVEGLPTVKGAKEVIRTLKSMNLITVLVTGGFDVVAKKLAERLGFDYWFANKLGVENDKLNGEVEVVVSGGESKLRILRDLAKAHGISLKECIAVGDGANDLEVLENVGLGIGFKPKPIVGRKVKAVINISDMNAILALIATDKLKEEGREV